MIYPVYEKYISREPFYSLYTAFRRNLHEEEIIVVIGYSFRDISVNNAFIDHICYNKKSRMIISTKSDPVKERIRRLFKGNIDRIATVSKYFGEDGFMDELQNKLSNEKSSIEWVSVITAKMIL